MIELDAAYELTPDPSHLGDDDFDATLVRFEGWETLAGLIPQEPLAIPENVFFEANVETLKSIDYPINDASWPIMSARMLAVLNSIGSFEHRAFPVVMLDDTVPPEKRFDQSGKPRAGVAVSGFFAVQITKYTEAFDWERSEYDRDEVFPGEVYLIHRLVLRDIVLPPLFRMTARSRPLMISSAGRTALDKAGIRGIEFLPLRQVV